MINIVLVMNIRTCNLHIHVLAFIVYYTFMCVILD